MISKSYLRSWLYDWEQTNGFELGFTVHDQLLDYLWEQTKIHGKLEDTVCGEEIYQLNYGHGPVEMLSELFSDLFGNPDRTIQSLVESMVLDEPVEGAD
ncbi:hypothetical protein CLV58_109243 [Spirosoma oryzae]|uniref:Uncharacterized protein n=1 Tax=Spirosoma oryzae TaxID=1469603 RepID=A0A2T0SYM8_9BACT|nr:hypothetical protein [Spirosoma oryzae]PRY38516.1 hypothetical protein CLV58_109243 [Spirosoma oryzae]